MIILTSTDNIDNQVIKGYKKGIKENEGDQSEIRQNQPAFDSPTLTGQLRRFRLIIYVKP